MCIRDLLTHGREEQALGKLYFGGEEEGRRLEKIPKAGGGLYRKSKGKEKGLNRPPHFRMAVLCKFGKCQWPIGILE